MNNKFVKKIYRESEINRIKAKITTLKNYPFDEIGFLNLRLITTLMIFFITLLPPRWTMSCVMDIFEIVVCH